jgi:hypothetical protein
MHEALGEWYSRKQEPAASCRQFRMALEAAKATGSRATMGRLKKKVRACGAASGA